MLKIYYARCIGKEESMARRGAQLLSTEAMLEGSREKPVTKHTRKKACAVEHMFQEEREILNSSRDMFTQGQAARVEET